MEEEQDNREAESPGPGRLHELVEDLEAIVWEADAATLRLTYVSEYAERLLGYPRARWLSAPGFLMEILHPEDRSGYEVLTRAAALAGESHELEYRVTAADGRVVWLRDLVRVARDERGQPRRLRGVMVDISARRAAETARRALDQEREQRLAHWRGLLDRLPIACTTTDSDSRFTYWNPAAEALFGCRWEEVRGRHPFEVMLPPAGQAYVAALFTRIEPDESDRLVSLTTRDGRLRVCRWRNLPLMDAGCRAGRRAQGAPGAAPGVRPAGMLSLCQEVTEPRGDPEALRRSEERLELALDAAWMGAWDWDLRTGAIVWSGRHDTLFGLPPGGFDGSYNAFRERVHPADLAGIEQAVEQARRERGEYHHEYRVIWPDGTLRWIAGRGRFQYEEAGEAVRMLGVVQDVTERRALEEQLRQSQKMEAIGRLAGGIAHDFNNLLAVINGYSELLLERASDQAGLASGLQQILAAGERAAELTRQLLVFGRRQAFSPRELELNELVAGVHPAVRQLLGTGAEVELLPLPGPIRVRADQDQLEQAVLDLAARARQAMPEGGRLTLRTATAEVRLHDPRAPSGLPPGEYGVLEVQDTGPDLDAEARSQIFEPFYSRSGVGHGLGLAAAYAAAQQGGGALTVGSAAEGGTLFRLYLPLAAAEEPAIAPGAPGPPPRGQETVLLVEDEPMVRSLAGEILREAGYRVLEAESAEAALAVEADHPGPIPLLLTDVVMPGRSGRELAEELRRRRPGVRVLYLSGYSDERATGGLPLGPGTGFLSKPFTPGALLQRVRAVLDEPA